MKQHMSARQAQRPNAFAYTQGWRAVRCYRASFAVLCFFRCSSASQTMQLTCPVCPDAHIHSLTRNQVFFSSFDVCTFSFAILKNSLSASLSSPFHPLFTLFPSNFIYTFPFLMLPSSSFFCPTHSTTTSSSLSPFFFPFFLQSNRPHTSPPVVLSECHQAHRCFAPFYRLSFAHTHAQRKLTHMEGAAGVIMSCKLPAYQEASSPAISLMVLQSNVLSTRKLSP